jgi:cytochrome P450
MQLVVDEIRSAFPTADDINFASTSKLSYLYGVIEESLRMYPPFVTSLARLSPPGGKAVDGYYVPENVSPLIENASPPNPLLLKINSFQY